MAKALEKITHPKKTTKNNLLGKRVKTLCK